MSGQYYFRFWRLKPQFSDQCSLALQYTTTLASNQKCLLVFHSKSANWKKATSTVSSMYLVHAWSMSIQIFIKYFHRPERFCTWKIVANISRSQTLSLLSKGNPKYRIQNPSTSGGISRDFLDIHYFNWKQIFALCRCNQKALTVSILSFSISSKSSVTSITIGQQWLYSNRTEVLQVAVLISRPHFCNYCP